MASWNRNPAPTPSRAPWIVAILIALVGFGGLSYWLKHRPTVVPVELPSDVPAEPVLVSSGTIGAGGSLMRSLGDSGLGSREVSSIEHALRPLFNPRHSHPSDRFEVYKSSSGQFVRLQYWPTSLEYFSVERSTVGAYTASAEHVPTTPTLVGVGGELQDSLWRSMSRQGVPAEMINRFADIFGWRFDFLTEPRAGDHYRMVWKRQVGNGAMRDGEIVCAYYQSRERGDLYAYALAGEYYDQAGESLRGEFLRAPLVYRRISSYFTNSRFHPILRYWRPHHGIDYSAPPGTPASTIGDGTIIEIQHGYNRGLGNEIRVRHAGSYVSIYGHLRAFAKGLHVGSRVRQGQVIGFVGSTGLSTGPHLHFGFESGGRMINFLNFKTQSKRKHVPTNEKQRFTALQRQGNSLLQRLPVSGGPLQTLSSSSDVSGTERESK